jgi:hypothetical protein
VNDVKSNVVNELGRELELRDAALKFRGPGTGDSEDGMVEGGVENEVRGGSMVSVSAEKDGLAAGGAFSSPL